MSRKKVLIITGEFDSTADGMVRCLKRMSAAFERFHPKEFPTKARMDLTISPNGSVVGDVVGPGVAFGWEEVGSVWYRRPEPYSVPPTLSIEEQEFATAESSAAFYGAWRTIGAFWVNHPDRNRIAASKALQIVSAQRRGFSIPKTLFTNDAEKLSTFYDEMNGNIVYKTMSQGILGRGAFRSVFTSRVKREHLQNGFLLSNGPGLFQEMIPKACDLRVTVIGERVFAVEIRAEPNSKENLDWRRFDLANLKHSAHCLTCDIEKRCLQLVHDLNLNYAAIDFILRDNGEYVFLEVNPNGQYGWIEDVIDMPITETLAELLVRHTIQF
ncbi:hypothetical protein C5688_14520 [Methylocystis sp. MitZ-2018]|nr:hypothetical protein C5688_14520 [Methylocystis sp. MitZ-2018]